jgi:two-component system, response regulator YesN
MLRLLIVNGIPDQNESFALKMLEERKEISSSLKSPYRPPLLTHFIEAGKWDKAAERLEDIFTELAEKWSESPEYAHEAFYFFMSTFHYMAHNSGRQLGEILEPENYGPIEGGIPDRSLKQLKEWVLFAWNRLREDTLHNTKDTRSFIVKRIHQYIEENISQDLTLQTLSEYVNLHPTYLSKMYKMETGNSLSEYLQKYRMEIAANLLRNSNEKIYEIATRTGYMTPHYFIKLFKNHFGMTPQEYRESIQYKLE